MGAFSFSFAIRTEYNNALVMRRDNGLNEWMLFREAAELDRLVGRLRNQWQFPVQVSFFLALSVQNAYELHRNAQRRRTCSTLCSTNYSCNASGRLTNGTLQTQWRRDSSIPSWYIFYFGFIRDFYPFSLIFTIPFIFCTAFFPFSLFCFCFLVFIFALKSFMSHLCRMLFLSNCLLHFFYHLLPKNSGAFFHFKNWFACRLTVNCK